MPDSDDDTSTDDDMPELEKADEKGKIYNDEIIIINKYIYIYI